MKRTLRKEVHVSVELSEDESDYVRTFLWNIPKKFYDEIAVIAKLSKQQITNVEGAIQDLCYELEIHDAERVNVEDQDND